MVKKNKMENEHIICRLMEGEAEDYIKVHRILELFKNMTALLLYHQPGTMIKHVNINFSRNEHNNLHVVCSKGQSRWK